MTDTVVILTSGTSWQTPADWNDAANTIECIGGGAAGTATKSGGGGAYAKVSNVSLSGAVSYAIGAGGTPSSVNGGDTWFGSSTTVKAAGAVGANGGTVANSVGDIKYAGGDATANQAGGGGAAGPNGAGEDGGNPGVTGGDGDAGHGGAGGQGGYGVPGGDGTEWGTAGSGGGASAAISAGGDGGNYGGGGGGSQHGTPGSGAPGVIVITYTPVSGGTTASLSGSADMGFSTAGSLGTIVALAGAAAMAFAAAGSLSTSGSAALSGSADMSFASAGALSTSGAASLSGSADMAFASSGALSTGADAALSGSADLVFSAVGALSGDQTALLSGAADLAFDVAGALGGTDGLSGAASLAFSSHGILTDSVPSHLYSNFEAVYAARQKLLNAIYAAAKGLADGAQNTANNALAQIGNLAGSQYLKNPFFTSGDLTGWLAESGWAFQSGSNGPSTSPSYAVHTGSSANANSALRNGGQIPAYPGMVLKAQCAVNGYGSPNGSCGVRISWRDNADHELSVTHGTRSSGNGANGTYVTGTAPANTMFAHVEADTLSHTSGSYAVDNFGAWVLPDSVDQIPDGTTYGRTKQTSLTNGDVDLAKGGIQGRILSNIGDGGGRYAVHQVDGNGLAVIDFSQSAHVNKTLDNIGDGATYARPFASRLNGGRPTINFAENIHTNKSLQYVGDGGGRYAAVHDAATQAQQAAQIAASYLPGQNIVPNSSFALGVPGALPFAWTSSGSWVGNPVAAGVPFATFAQIAITSAAPSTNVIYSPYLPVQANSAYSLQLQYAIARTLSAGDFAGDIEWYTSAGGFISRTAHLFNASSDSANAAVNIQALNQISPATTAYARLRLYSENAAETGGTVYFNVSRIKIEIGSKCTPYTDDASQFGNQLAAPGSGQTIGDQRNLVSSITRNLGIVRSATALTCYSDGHVNVNAHNIRMGGALVSYNAVANAVTGLSQNSSYYIYTRDNYAGGSPTWGYSTDSSTVNSYDDAYNAGVVTIPTSGSGGGGAGGGGPLGACVCANMLLRPGLTARDLAQRWRWWKPRLWMLQGPDGWHLVRRRPRIVPYQACRITVADGSWIECSNVTPVDTRSGGSVLAPMLHGCFVCTDSGWQQVINVELLPGQQDVVRINVGGNSFYAGADPYRRIGTHNTYKP